MNASGVLAPISAKVAANPRTEQDDATVNRFVQLAVRGLEPMLDKQRQLFCFRLRKTDQGMVQEGISHRYTAMTLMGLHRLRQAGTTSLLDTKSILEALLSDLAWVDNVGDLGMLMWMCSVLCPERLSELEPRLELQSALKRFRGARQGVTMDLSWFLTGLSYWAEVDPQKQRQLEALCLETYRNLTTNQGERGFFTHLSTVGSLEGRVRGRIGSFADQVYPIYGMAQFSKVFGHEEASKRALQCARGICEEQGQLGQWWWHYDAPAGRVADGYPVFSVHQHAMGPMTLFKLGDVLHQSFDEWIYKGLRWINSNNELGYNMEASENVIWRCIFRSRRSLGGYLKAPFGRPAGTIQQSPEDLKVLFECRPYELGWLLYAFAGR